MNINGDIVTSVMGYAAVVLSYFVAVPQIIKMVRTRSVKDISKASLFLLLTVDLLYLVRAVYIKEPIFILGKMWAVTVILIQIVLVFYFMSKYGKDKKKG